jgi:hypothetical protein
MRLPVLRGVIGRRILINFRIRPEALRPVVPHRFRFKLQGGHAIAGVCLIRLEGIRPRFVPRPFGFRSENAAHRVAVLWRDELGDEHDGVFIFRRDTGSTLNRLAGGRVFPGEHQRATFRSSDSCGRIELAMASADGFCSVAVKGEPSAGLPAGSVFGSVAEASRFFETGSVSYSTTGEPNRLDGIALRTSAWSVEPFDVDEVFSSYFMDQARFPGDSAVFDHALLMRNVDHEWREIPDLSL